MFWHFTPIGNVRNTKRPTKRAADLWDSAAFSSIFLVSSFFCSWRESHPAHKPLTPTVETVEKVGESNAKQWGFIR